MLAPGFSALLGTARPGHADPGALFKQYLGDTPPKVVEVIDKKTEGPIEVSHLRFLSRTLPPPGSNLFLGEISAD